MPVRRQTRTYWEVAVVWGGVAVTSVPYTQHPTMYCQPQAHLMLLSVPWLHPLRPSPGAGISAPRTPYSHHSSLLMQSSLLILQVNSTCKKLLEGTRKILVASPVFMVSATNKQSKYFHSQLERMWQRGLKAGSDVGRSLPHHPFTVPIVVGQPALTMGRAKCSISWVPSRGEGPLPERSVQHQPLGCGAVWVWRHIPVPTSSSVQAASPAGQTLVEMSVLPQVRKQGDDEVMPEEPARLGHSPRH